MSVPAVASISQGFSMPVEDRMPLMAMEAMTPAQREAAQVLIDGPRKAVFGPFIALLRSPVLMERVGKLGEYLRFESVLEARIRELATCIAARHVGNQFEWLMHAPLALKAGVDPSVIDDIATGRRPRRLQADENTAFDFATEMLQQNGASSATYAEALAAFGEQGVVDLATLVGYFVMVSWVMNVARTPFQGAAGTPALTAFPA
jgi:4-carboxymuconolactone decarboxylase